MAASPTVRRAGRHAMRIVWRFAKRFLSLVPVIRYDGLGPGAAGYPSKFDLQSSLFIWVCVLPFAVVGAGAINPLVYLLLIPLLPAGAYFAARRSAAGLNSEPLRRREWASRFAGMLKATPSAVEGGAPKVRWAFYAMAGAVVLLGFGAALPWLVNGAFADELSLLQPAASKWALVSWLGYTLILVVSWMVGRAYGREGSDAQQVEALWTAQIARVLDVSVNDYIAGSGAFVWGQNQESLTITVPVAARMRLAKIEERCSLVIPGWTVASAGYDIVELVRVESLPEVMLGREAAGASGGLIASIEKGHSTAARPDHSIWTLAPGTSASQANLVAEFAANRGETLVSWKPYAMRANVARLPRAVRELRDGIAGQLGIPTWDIELIVKTTKTDAGNRVDSVEFARFPATLDGPLRVKRYMTAVESLLPAAGYFWHATDAVVEGRMLFERHIDLLAESFGINDFIERYRSTEIAPEDAWKGFPVAISEDGLPVTYGTFQTLIVGQTGAGKGSVIWSILSGLLPSARAGLVRFFAIDPKDAEAKAAEHVFEEIVTEPEGWSGLLERLVVELKKRQGTGRKPPVSAEAPLIMLFIDEMSALTMLDVDTKRRTEVMQNLLLLLSQGRSNNVLVMAAVQAPQKELIGQARMFMAMRVAMRTETAAETDLVLGADSTAGGAAAHLIPVANEGNRYATAGIAYMRTEGTPNPVRVRFPYTDDATLTAWSDEFAALRAARNAGVDEPEVVDLGSIEVDFDFEAAEKQATDPKPPGPSDFQFSFDD